MNMTACASPLCARLSLWNLIFCLLSKATSLTLSLQQSENVTFTDRALDVTDQRSTSKFRSRFCHEHHSDLNNTTSGTSSAKHLIDLCELNTASVHFAQSKDLFDLLTLLGNEAFFFPKL
eukprot:TRINITY_DN749_c0_g1_i1.p1 TRINITY_DN749_c0_g1~~TRINITY_DN749_c0_g1_i1.p1  ORF type:complete len:120 (-),score=9.02 TRINITY_DN749_c0_g1_i1:15-374(-)